MSVDAELNMDWGFINNSYISWHRHRKECDPISVANCVIHKLLPFLRASLPIIIYVWCVCGGKGVERIQRGSYMRVYGMGTCMEWEEECGYAEGKGE